MEWQVYESLIGNWHYANNSGKYGHDFVEVKIVMVEGKPYQIEVTDGFQTLKHTYCGLNWSMETAKKVALELYNEGMQLNVFLQNAE